MQTEAVPSLITAPVPAQPIPWTRQFWLIFRLQWADYREFAAQLILFSLLMPIGFQILLGEGLRGLQSASWFLAGNVIISVAFGSSSFVLFRMGQLKLQGQLDYYATLPLAKSSFIAALFCLSQFSALPGLLGSFLVGHMWLDIPLNALWVALPIALIAAVSLTVTGAALGSIAKHFGQLNLLNNMVYFVTVFLSPALVPIERMPLLLRIISYVLPTGQAALALTDALTGSYGRRFFAMMGGLLFWLVIAMTVGVRQLDWRKD